jgi:hypothetical protein
MSAALIMSAPITGKSAVIADWIPFYPGPVLVISARADLYAGAVRA